MSHLRRELAPISERAWEVVDEEAGRALRSFLAARKLVDVTGPLGWEHSSVNLGSVHPLGASPRAGVEAKVRDVIPMLEFRSPFTLTCAELDAIDRGSRSPDLTAVVDAARSAAYAEDAAIFNGFAAANVCGITDVSPHPAVPIDDDYEEFPGAVARAVATLREAGVDGPYGIALGPRCYTGVIETTQKGGYPVLEQLRLITGGPLTRAAVIDGSVVLSMRGGDFELTLGDDFGIGFAAINGTDVELFIEESLAFRAHAPEAAVALTYQA
jgi:uncharacterized linocin/CFP29 family protein